MPLASLACVAARSGALGESARFLQSMAFLCARFEFSKGGHPLGKMDPLLILQQHTPRGCIELIRHGTAMGLRNATIVCLNALTQGRTRNLDAGRDAVDVILSTLSTWPADPLVTCSVMAATAHVTRRIGLGEDALDKVLTAIKAHSNDRLSSQAACRLLFYHVASPQAMTRLPQVTRAIAKAMSDWPFDDLIQWFGGKALLVIHKTDGEAVANIHGQLELQVINQAILVVATAATHVCVHWRGKGWNAVVVADHPRMRR